MTTDTAEYKFQRTINTSPARLWHLLTDPQMRGQWNAPSDDVILTPTISDLREGGIERHVAGDPAAPEFEAETRWYRLAEPSDAIYTETIEAGGQTIATQLVTYRIASTDSGCQLDITVAVSSHVGPEAPAEFHHGWETALTNLGQLASRVAA